MVTGGWWVTGSGCDDTGLVGQRETLRVQWKFSSATLAQPLVGTGSVVMGEGGRGVGEGGRRIPNSTKPSLILLVMLGA